jgi:hypothetical protein
MVSELGGRGGTVMEATGLTADLTSGWSVEELTRTWQNAGERLPARGRR